MATFLDVTGLEHFSSFFVFIFVWLAVYAVLIYTKIFGENKAISIIIGLLIGIFVLFSPIASGVIQYIAPWFAVIFIFIILISVVSKMFGAAGFESYSSLKWILLVVILITIIVGSLSYVREKTVIPGENETGEDIDYAKTTNFFFHPKVLGMLFVLIIAVFTIALLANKSP